MEACIIIAALLSLVICCCIYRNRKMYRDVDRLFEQILSREAVMVSDVKEGELSALANKAKRIQAVIGAQVARAEEEKEQVKSLVSNMSHQLKTPLATISVYSDILSSKGLEEKKREQAADKMKKQIDKLDWTIASLAKMVNLEQDAIAFEAGCIPIRQTVIEAIDAVYGKAQQKRISFKAAPYEDCLLYHNRKWTVEVFVNILENAVKYTEEGGTIRIEVCPYEMYTQISFIDNGCGIHKEELTQIFQRFYRGRETGHIEGSGIGLYLSNLILEKEKGYMTVKSVYGEGSCFSVFLQNCKNL